MVGRYKGFQLWGNDWIRDEPGKTVPWLTLEDLQKIKSWGFNTVSILFFWTRFQMQDGTIEPTMLARLDRIVDLVEQAGLNLIIENRITWGKPLDTGTWTGWLHYWSEALSEPLLTMLCGWIKFLAERYLGRPHVIGLGACNFPYHNQSIVTQEEADLYYNEVTPRLIDAIRQVSNKTIFYPTIHKQWHPCWRNPTLNPPPPPPDSNMIYIWDAYLSWELRHCQVTWDYDMERLINDGKQPMIEAINFCREHHVPLLVDEFGVVSECTENKDKLDFLRASLEEFDKWADAGWMHEHGYSGLPFSSLVDVTTHESVCPNTLALLKEFSTTPTPPIMATVAPLTVALILTYLGIS